MNKDWISRHPRIIFLLIGLSFAIFTNVGQYVITKDYTRSLETSLEKTSQKITSLSEENKKLKQSTKTYKIIKPDGTVEETSQTELESSSEVITKVKMEYDVTIQKMKEEMSEKLKYSNPLLISVGMTLDSDYMIDINYTLAPPLTFGIGGIFSKDNGNKYWISIGVRL